jgi:hypothetical protein
MRLPRLRFSVRALLAFVALAALSLGAERLWMWSSHYRRQAALCAFFELQNLWYAAQSAEDPYAYGTAEETREEVRAQLAEAQRYGALKDIYRRLARRPWESLPRETPVSVNPWDLRPLSAQEIEEMVESMEEARRAGQK